MTPSDRVSPQVPTDWRELLKELEQRNEQVRAMGGTERLERQRSRGKLNARERIEGLCDPGSFEEIGALVGSQHPGGAPPVPADGLVGGLGRIDGRPAVILAEDFTVQGGSIGHGNHAKRVRLTRLAEQERIPVVLMLDGAGERATNALERYAYAPNDLQVLADLHGQVPIVSLVLGNSAGHGALSGLFADLIVMVEGAALFTAGPPLVEAALGVQVSPEALGGAELHTQVSGVAHNRVENEEEAFALTRRFLSYLPASESEPPPLSIDDPAAAERRLEDLLRVVPRNVRRVYDMRDVVQRLCDDASVLELQPDYGQAILTCLARLGGVPVLIVANQPAVQGGAITREAACKATHFLKTANAFGLPVVFLADNPGVMAGPDAERSGILRAAAEMFAAQRALQSPKLHVTLRKAFGFGASLMGMNPFDHQTLTLAFPGISLGGVPAASGAASARARADETESLVESQSAAWGPADNGSYDRVIDPRDLRNELIHALQIT